MRITGCSVALNGTAGVGTGISVGPRASIDGCNVSSNQASGISAGDDCKIGGCDVCNNPGDGIVAANRAFLSDNQVNGNGTTGVRGCGIHITGKPRADCRKPCLDQPEGRNPPG